MLPLIANASQQSAVMAGTLQLVAALVLMLAVFSALCAWRYLCARRPLAAYSSRVLELAFREAPEIKQRAERNKTLSRLELRQAMKLTLSRVQAELARRNA
jgi:hypothetical protein